MHMWILLVLVACVAAQRALFPANVASLAAAPAAFTNFPALAPFPTPLAISNSQRLDYFNQFNAAFAPPAPPPARLVATPAGLAAFPEFFGLPAATRFGQPARLLAPVTAAAPFIY